MTADPFASLPLTPSPPPSRPGRRANQAPEGKGRATADLVAGVLIDASLAVSRLEAERWREVADRLAELDAEVAKWNAKCDEVGVPHDPDVLVEHHRANAGLAAYINGRCDDALRPDCPTCGGTETVPNPTDHYVIEGLYRCPDCVDGRVPIERLVATWQAVAGEVAHYDEHYPMGGGLTEIGRACRELVNRLRSVKP